MSNSANGYNAVGNPYPSSLDMDAFITGNSAAIEGTLWFWRKTNDATNAVSYSTCSTVGCTLENGHNYINENYISVGQGFIVKAKAGQSSVAFNNNSMRSSQNVNQFFRTATTVDRFWLELKNAANASFGQKLIAYVADATNGYDSGLDGLFINDRQTAMFSMADDKEVVIQARPSFNSTDVVPLVFKTNVADTYTVSLAQLDGLFSGTQDIFLRDILTGNVQDLKAGAYTFASEVGIFTNRFEVIYQPLLAVNPNTFDSNNVVVYKQGQDLVINSGKAMMSTVKIFDIRGRLILEKKNINAVETRMNTGTTNQVLMVQIITDKGTVTKKVIN